MYIIFRYVYFSAVLLVSPVCLFSDLFTLGSKNQFFYDQNSTTIFSRNIHRPQDVK